MLQKEYNSSKIERNIRNHELRVMETTDTKYPNLS